MLPQDHPKFKERNEEIRRLSAKGVPQWIIMDRFGLSQPRISAILYFRRPTRRYCQFHKRKGGHSCKAVVPYGGGLCPAHASFMAERRIKNLLAREKAALTRKAAWEARKARGSERDRLRLYRKFLKLLRRRAAKSEPRSPYRGVDTLFDWQTEGRERVRYMVRRRDNYTCQDCGAVRTPEEVAEKNHLKPRSAKSFDVHHIDGLCGTKSRGYDAVADMHLLVTLCHKCHFGRHDFSKRVDGKWKAVPTPLSPSYPLPSEAPTP